MRYLVLVFCLFRAVDLTAQPAERPVKIIVTPDHADWQYKLGEPAKFTVTVYRYNVPVRGAKLHYEVGPERMKPVLSETRTLPNGTLTIDGGSMKQSGFLRCVATAEVDGAEYRGLCTAGFEPLTLQPTVQNPPDFEQFWNDAKAELAKLPVDARLRLLPERCTATVNVYEVNMQNYGTSRLYGIVCIPKAEGKYPALLRVPGAGVRPYYGDVAMAEKGVITLEIGIHGIPVTLDPAVYDNLRGGPLLNYQNANLDDRNRYYYKRVYLGCVRAVDFLTGLPQYDGQTIGVTGGSQGGALSIITAALDTRIKWLGAFYPALSDMTGDLKGRAGGWPHLFEGITLAFNNTPAKINTLGYYDVVNFARLVRVPGTYAWGYNDETCPPTSMYAAYNTLSSPKSLSLYLDTGHWQYAEEREWMNNWLLEHLKGAR